MKTYYEYISSSESPSRPQEDDPRFSFWIRHALLLSLKDQGFLTDIQYHYAEELLKKQAKTPYTFSQPEYRHA